MPVGACDTHMHVFGSVNRYRFVPDRSYTPPQASLKQYEALANTLNFSRFVIVQPSIYGTDNACTLDVVCDTRLDARAVVVVDDHVDGAELERMHEAGARGIRINLLFRGGVQFAAAERLADQLRDMGWHVQVLLDVSRMADLKDRLVGLNLPVVFDHMGHLSTVRGLSDPGFCAMRDLVADGIGWVKLSGAYRMTAQQQPPYGDVAPFARELVEANAERCLWATDWPHPAVVVPMPNDGDLIDMLVDWVPEEIVRNRILVDNPACLYGFGRDRLQ
ncbi:MAG: amidohydrolase family protein [Alphaproteobacteria bacterium]|jgi:predicted TIM-barrel fold metal-dependent hydrolase|nr:amidohydrolase family protein [Alphaproteobacteria bacterium]